MVFRDGKAGPGPARGPGRDEQSSKLRGLFAELRDSRGQRNDFAVDNRKWQRAGERLLIERLQDFRDGRRVGHALLADDANVAFFGGFGFSRLQLHHGIPRFQFGLVKC
jgi:hypothetical protein